MLRTSDTHREFEAVAKAYLAEHPEIRHVWRPVSNVVSGGRTDLVCEPDTPNEVWASLSEGRIAVGDKGEEHVDFEAFGRSLSERELAVEAFGRVVALLEQKGIVLNAGSDA